MRRYTEEGQKRFLGIQHPGFQYLQIGWKYILPLVEDKIEQPALIRYVPSGITRTIVWQDGRLVLISPFTKSETCVHNKEFDHSRTVRLEEKILIGLFLQPELVCHLNAFIAGTHCSNKGTV
jgi:hypothetical protein